MKKAHRKGLRKEKSRERAERRLKIAAALGSKAAKPAKKKSV